MDRAVAPANRTDARRGEGRDFRACAGLPAGSFAAFSAAPRVLVIGYGNPGRGDDGVGPALAVALDEKSIPGVHVEVDYQLSIEHAALAAEHDVVVFVDAAADARADFYLEPLCGTSTEGCFSHSLTPAQVLGLSHACFGAAPCAYVLGIRARALDRFEEGLTPEAQSAVASALDRLVRFIGDLFAWPVQPPR